MRLVRRDFRPDVRLRFGDVSRHIAGGKPHPAQKQRRRARVVLADALLISDEEVIYLIRAVIERAVIVKVILRRAADVRRRLRNEGDHVLGGILQSLFRNDGVEIGKELRTCAVHAQILLFDERAVGLLGGNISPQPRVRDAVLQDVVKETIQGVSGAHVPAVYDVRGLDIIAPVAAQRGVIGQKIVFSREHLDPDARRGAARLRERHAHEIVEAERAAQKPVVLLRLRPALSRIIAVVEGAQVNGPGAFGHHAQHGIGLRVGVAPLDVARGVQRPAAAAALAFTFARAAARRLTAAFLDREDAELERHFVICRDVLFRFIIDEHLRDGVIALPHLRARARDGDLRRMPLNGTVDGRELPIVLAVAGERRAVVDLAGTAGAHRDGHRADEQCTVKIADVVII